MSALRLGKPQLDTNPRVEGRRPKEIRNPKSEGRTTPGSSHCGAA